MTNNFKILYKDEDTNKYVVACSICSIDEELWPVGSIKVTEKSLKNGNIPCGCTSNVRWKDWQYKLRVTRACLKEGYLLLGTLGAAPYKRTSRLILYNPVTGNKWDTTTIGSFLKGVKDPSIKFNKKSESEYTKVFMSTGSYPERSKFVRGLSLVQTYWKFTCPRCKVDEYAKAEVSDGTFQITTSSLTRGSLPCRCHKRYNWTQEEREYQLKTKCSAFGGEFLGWYQELRYKDGDSKFSWRCKYAHKNINTVENFLNPKILGCPKCYKERQKREGTLFGYYPDKRLVEDELYLMTFDNKYLKVGRSFKVRERVVQLQKKSKCEDVKVISTLKGDHESVFSLEQSIHRVLEKRGFQVTVPWKSNECFDMNSFKYVLRLLQDAEYRIKELEDE